jgi:phage/plasmid primase-like uncharacterized protein
VVWGAPVTGADDFRSFLAERLGCEPPARIEPGRFVRGKTPDWRNGHDALWAKLFPDFQGGIAGDFRSGETCTWQAKRERSLSGAERQAFLERIERERREAEALRDKEEREAAQRAADLWNKAQPAPADHPYLVAKGIKPHGLKLYRGPLAVNGMRCNGALILPVRNPAGEIQTLQFIAPNGEKRFLPGGRKSGGYLSFGKAEGALCIAEGFATGASVHEATGQAIAVAFDAGNILAVAKAMRKKFSEARIIICGDNDESGTGQRAAEEAARAASGLVAVPAEAGKDWNDVHRAHGAEAVQRGVANAKAPVEPRAQSSVTAVHAKDERRQTPRPLPDPLPQVAAFDPALLPEAVRPWCEDAAEALSVPLEFLAVPAVVALAADVGRIVGVRVKRNDRWIERPMLWGAIVGRPSTGKSPAMLPARRMLQRLEAEALKTHHESVRAYEADKLVAEANTASAKEAIKAAVKSGNQAEAQAAAARAAEPLPTPPAEPRIVTSDATIEKLGELLHDNPRGLLLLRDELTGWLASLDREGREADRGFWLECWNGTGPYVCDRIGRGTVRIEACAVSILGGIQPGRLADYVRSAVRGGVGDDGLMQRFQLAVYPDLPAGWRYVDRAPNETAERRAWETFSRLRALTPEGVGAERAEWCDVPYLALSGEALQLYIEWQSALMPRLRAGNEPAHLEAHFAKYPSLAARLALVLHLCDAEAGPVSGEAMARALDWCTYLESHARRIYAPLTGGDLMAAHLLLKRRAELPGAFSARDVYRRCWAGLDRETVGEALDLLTEYGHLVPAEADYSTGRPTERYRWRAEA